MKTLHSVWSSSQEEQYKCRDIQAHRNLLEVPQVLHIIHKYLV